jgi:hypothetical protein
MVCLHAFVDAIRVAFPKVICRGTIHVIEKNRGYCIVMRYGSSETFWVPSLGTSSQSRAKFGVWNPQILNIFTFRTLYSVRTLRNATFPRRNLLCRVLDSSIPFRTSSISEISSPALGRDHVEIERRARATRRPSDLTFKTGGRTRCDRTASHLFTAMM